jgi:DNA-binding transcriptional ArsR family regulator
MKNATAEQDDAVWKALADPTRRTILEYLHDEALTTGELCKHFPSITRYGVMKHLSVLEDAKLVSVRREGRLRWNIYSSIPMNTIIAPWVTKHLIATKDRFERLCDLAETLNK